MYYISVGYFIPGASKHYDPERETKHHLTTSVLTHIRNVQIFITYEALEYDHIDNEGDGLRDLLREIATPMRKPRTCYIVWDKKCETRLAALSCDGLIEITRKFEAVRVYSRTFKRACVLGCPLVAQRRESLPRSYPTRS